MTRTVTDPTLPTLGLGRTMSSKGNESREVLAKAAKQSLRIAALAKLAILKAKAPETFHRLMYLEALRRGLTKPKG